jgi:hypothetical protein
MYSDNEGSKQQMGSPKTKNEKVEFKMTKTTTAKKEKKVNPKIAAFLKEQEAKKKAEAERIANLKGFEKEIHEKQLAVQEAIAAKKKIEAELAKAKDVEKAIHREIQHMNAIQKMASWTANNSMKWYKEDAKYLRDEAWKYYQKLVTTVLEATITIAERTDMKKFKYEVSVSGHSTSFTGEEYSFNGGTYKDYDAMKKVDRVWAQVPNTTNWGYVPVEGVTPLELTKKFAKREDAEAYAEEWKKRIEKHYKKELKLDRDMLKRAMKK